MSAPRREHAAEKASMYYGYVRGLQLEGRYPRDVGISPITPMRVRMYWGSVPWGEWPIRPDDPFPPEEPPGLDRKAKRLRIDTYVRVRSSRDAATAMQKTSQSVSATVRVTRRGWLRGGTNGIISMPVADDEFVGEHAVLLTSFLGAMFRFDNSWGERWGDQGRGWLPYEYLDRYGVGAFLPFHVLDVPSPNTDGVARYPVDTPVGRALTLRLHDVSTGRRDGWAIAIERDGLLDVEEFFVMPQARGKGCASRLAEVLLAESRSARRPLRAWVPEVDADGAGLAGVQKIAEMLHLVLQPSPTPWAKFIAVG